MLLDRRANIDAVDAAGMTALHCAVAMQNKQAAVLLVARGADVQVGPTHPHTPTPTPQSPAVHSQATTPALTALITQLNKRETQSVDIIAL
jgi:ankyrin repeat protein